MQTQVTAEELGWSTRNCTNWAKRKAGGLVSRSCMLGVTKMNVHEILLSVCAIISHTKNKIVFSDMVIEVPLESVRITCLHLRAEFGPKSLVRTLCWNPTENKGVSEDDEDQTDVAHTEIYSHRRPSNTQTFQKPHL